jgi:hypothetical protein
LRAKGRKAASGSLHTEGLAADVAFPAKELRPLWLKIRELDCCGAGYYQSSGFLHLDVGAPRFWEPATSKVEENLSAGNARLFARTEYDRYAVGEPIVVTLHALTAPPVLIAKEAMLVDGERHRPVRVDGGSGEREGCLDVRSAASCCGSAGRLRSSAAVSCSAPARRAASGRPRPWSRIRSRCEVRSRVRLNATGGAIAGDPPQATKQKRSAGSDERRREQSGEVATGAQRERRMRDAVRDARDAEEPERKEREPPPPPHRPNGERPHDEPGEVEPDEEAARPWCEPEQLRETAMKARRQLLDEM